MSNTVKTNKQKKEGKVAWGGDAAFGIGTRKRKSFRRTKPRSHPRKKASLGVRIHKLRVDRTLPVRL